MGDSARPGRVDGSVRPTVALIEALRPLDARGTDLLGALAHQLRTPLTSALGYLELLADATLGPVTAEQADALRTIGASVRRLAGLVDELDPALREPPAAGPSEPAAKDGP